MSRAIAVLSLVIILMIANWAIISKEKHLSEGDIVYLELAPVDPRSLMQGDYMALRFRLANDIYKSLHRPSANKVPRREMNASDGYVIVRLDERRTGSFHDLYSGQALSDNDILMRYRVRNDVVKFATNAFFFQEGNGKIYQQARYGQFHVDDKGELLLTAMYDKTLDKIEPVQPNK